jgi:hypothetical protein
MPMTQPFTKDNPVEMTLEELLDYRENFNHELENIAAAIQVINGELLERLKSKKLSGTVVGNRTITKASRINFKVDLETAKELGAIKEAIDNAKLKKLYIKGVDLPHTVTEYVLVKEIKKDE